VKGLRARERQVALLLAHGHMRRQIAQLLEVTETTIGNDMRYLRIRTDSTTTVEAVVKLARAGLV
jgi:DNA-binding CsgD family transcriptional regulator